LRKSIITFTYITENDNTETELEEVWTCGCNNRYVDSYFGKGIIFPKKEINAKKKKTMLAGHFYHNYLITLIYIL
jgi:hypothetical protein